MSKPARIIRGEGQGEGASSTVAGGRAAQAAVRSLLAVAREVCG